MYCQNKNNLETCAVTLELLAKNQRKQNYLNIH